MELKNTEDLRGFLRDTIHERWTNVTAVSKRAKVSQAGLQKFIKGTNGKAISTYTMFPILEVLGVRLVVVPNVPKEAHYIPVIEPTELKQTITKESLSSELRNRIEEYKSEPEPKPKFSVDLIIEFLEESYDKLATI